MPPFRAIFLLLLLCAGAPEARGGTLPVRPYTTADGLASNFVQRVVRDSRGFLWLCTRGGLSRFDGHSFENYTTADGLPNATVNDLIEARDGRYWIATNGGGVARLDPARRGARPAVFGVGATARTNRVNRLHEDRRGRLWAATDGGLFVLEGEGAAFRFVAYEAGAEPSPRYAAAAIAEDGAGDVWVDAEFGLARVRADGRGVETYARPRLGLPGGFEITLATDAQGRLWAAAFDRVCRLARDPRPEATAVEGCREVGGASAENPVSSFHQESGGRAWLTTRRGVAEFAGGGLAPLRAAGLDDFSALADCAEDAEGNLWVGTAASGVLKVTRNGFAHFPETGRRASTYGIVSLGEDSTGDILAADDRGQLYRLDGESFRAARPALPPGAALTWMTSAALRDGSGQVWVLTSTHGLFRFAGVENLSRPLAVYGRRTGLPGDFFFRAYEDSRGDLWFSLYGEERDRLLRWERATESFRLYTVEDGLPAANSAFSFAEDPAGNLWVGFYDGGVARLRAGRFEFYSAAEGFPDHMVTDLHLDRRGRLWLASNVGGLLRVDDPAAARPAVSARYKTAEGLSSDDVRSVVDDLAGRIYVGTIRGLDRLDPETGGVVHFGLNDGLPNDFVISSMRDSRGRLWFGTLNGVARLTPGDGRASADAPDAFITSLRAGGVERPVAELGEREIAGLELAPDEGSVQIEFGAVSFRFGAGLRFRYRVEGAAGGAWSAPTDQRGVNLSLGPGAYRFAVEAVGPDGSPLGGRAAAVSFTVLRPAWQRPWFVASALALAALAAFALYRYRVRHLLAVERVRTRIASDLHDDIGASLSQIAVVSEVLRRQMPAEDERVGRNLSLVARVSREAVDAMGDIVWAINPQRDTLTDLVRRMRRFASETLPNRDIALDFRAPNDAATGLRAGADFRREVFLIFKEAVNNVLKHSGATRARVEVKVERGRLLLTVSDDGRGLDAGANGNGDGPGGHGLTNMRRRAAALGGTLDIDSPGGRGTRLTLSAPL